MPRPSVSADSTPDWVGLMETARACAGFFTASDALAHHVSPQLLRYRVERGWVRHELRGVYRFTSAPPTEHDELIAFWRWSDGEGAYSHVTALALHELSDALPAKIHMTVPASWRYARFAQPRHLVLHVADLGPKDVQWFGHVPITTVARTLADCIAAHVSATLVAQGLAQARRRGLLTAAEHARIVMIQRRRT